MPFSYNGDNETVELLFGSGDIGIGGRSSWRESNLDLVDLGQPCCIGAPVKNEYMGEEETEDRRVTLSYPVTPRGLNALRTLVYQSCRLLHSLYSRTLRFYAHKYKDMDTTELASQLLPSETECILCYNHISKDKKMLSIQGLFICHDCIDTLYNAIHNKEGIESEYWKIRSIVDVLSDMKDRPLDDKSLPTTTTRETPDDNR